MSENPSKQSLYTVQLDTHHQSRFENKNLADAYTDVYLFSPTELRKYLEDLAAQSSTPIYYGYHGNRFDQQLRYYPCRFTIPEEPQIVEESGAMPCSLLAAWDKNGNYCSLHLSHYQSLEDNNIAADAEELREFGKFIRDHMDNSYRVMMTATNVDPATKEKVIASIKKLLPWQVAEKLELFFTFHHDSPEQHEHPDQKTWLSSHQIESICFIPHDFTPDGRQKIIMMGFGDEINSDDYQWTVRGLTELFPEREIITPERKALLQKKKNLRS